MTTNPEKLEAALRRLLLRIGPRGLAVAVGHCVRRHAVRAHWPAVPARLRELDTLAAELEGPPDPLQ